MKHLLNALQIGDTYPRTGYSYSEADNTYTPYTYEARAWACAIRSRLPQPEIGDLWEAIFGE
jgi:hypothetical protein